MRRRLLELCLLAYPRAHRERDRDYLRDLSLDLAETHGLGRQAISLLFGGLKERIEGRRRRGGARMRTRARRAAIASFTLAAVALAAIALVGTAGRDGGSVYELEEYACAHADEQPSSREPGNPGGCAETGRLAAAREREGWSCTTRRHTGAGRRATTWECTRRETAVAWLPL